MQERFGLQQAESHRADARRADHGPPGQLVLGVGPTRAVPRTRALERAPTVAALPPTRKQVTALTGDGIESGVHWMLDTIRASPRTEALQSAAYKSP